MPPKAAQSLTAVPGAGRPGKRPPLTHFLCIPLVDAASRPQLEASLARFKEEAKSHFHARAMLPGDNAEGDGEDRAKANARAVLDILRSDRAVRPVGTLHLTLGVMSLEDGQQRNSRVQDAVRLLQGLDLAGMLRNVEGPPGVDRKAPSPPLRVDLKGLRSMSSPIRSSALYAAPVDASGRLAPFCEKLRAAFMDAGLMVREQRALKLHATILNTVYQRPGGRRGGLGQELDDADGADEASKLDDASADDDEAHRETGESLPQGITQPKRPPNRARRPPGPEKFDARDMLAQFEEFEWITDLRLCKVAICEMGAAKVRDAGGNVVDEAYTEVFARSLPGGTA